MSWNGRRGNRKRDREDGGDGLSNHSVPFEDGHPELGELPLDDIDSFVVPARDEKGAYTTLHVNVPPYLYRQLQIVVKSGRFPYLDVSDLARHALTRQLHFCVGIRQSIPQHIYTSTEAIMEVCRDNELRLRVSAAFEEIDRQITGHLDRLEIGDAIRLLNILKNRSDGVPHSPRQHHLRSGILRRFGHVLEHNNNVRPMTDAEREQEGITVDNPVGQPDSHQDHSTGSKGVAHGKTGGYQ